MSNEGADYSIIAGSRFPLFLWTRSEENSSVCFLNASQNGALRMRAWRAAIREAWCSQ